MNAQCSNLCYLLVLLTTVENVLKVSEMKAEYFPPREDVILQNEAPTDLYIVVTGIMVINTVCPSWEACDGSI